MTFDLLSTVLLTADAAIVIATLAINVGATTPSRIRLASALTLWFAAIVAIAATQLFSASRGPLGVVGLGVAVVAPVIVLALIAAATTTLRERLVRIPLSTLVAVHAVRIAGVLFVMLYAFGRLPAPFAPSAGWGDIFIGVTALPLAWLVARRASGWRSLLGIWNLLGITDLVFAIGFGVTSSPGPLHLIEANVDSSIMATLPWLLIPAYLVPLLFTVHLVIGWRLRMEDRETTTAAPVSAATAH